MSMIDVAANGLPLGERLAAIQREGQRRNPLLWSAAIFLSALMIPTTAAYLLDGRQLYDINVWSKPLKFEFSLVLYLATLAWFWGYLPTHRRHGRFLNTYAILVVGTIALELAYIIIQASRGVASHFNQSTQIEAILFPVMGAGALFLTTMAPVLGVALARSRRDDLAPAFRLAVILGLILTFVLGATAGMVMAQNGGHWVAAAHTDAGGFPVFGWTRTGGDLRVAHFLGIHAMQILPLAGWFIARRRADATGLVWLAAAALTALTGYTLVEALAGRPFLAFIG
jgi:hypothetical protein